MTEQLPEPGTFAAKVQALDAFLTGKDARTVAQTYRNASNKTPGEWAFMRDAYYLSDGGYSRAVCRLDEDDVPHLFLTSNSRPEVAERWRYCLELVADIEAEICVFLNHPGNGE